MQENVHMQTLHKPTFMTVSSQLAGSCKEMHAQGETGSCRPWITA